jgi:hypothetical protein
MANTLEFIIKATDQASTVVGTIEGKIGGLGKSFTSSLKDMQAGFQMAERVVSKVYDALLGDTIKYAQAVKDLSVTLSLSAEETSRLMAVSQKFGVSTDTLSNSLNMMTKRGMAPSLAGLAELSDKMMAIQNPVERAAALTDLFGRNWTALMPIIDKGGAAIRSAADEAAGFGRVLSKDDVDAVEALQIKMNTLKESADGVANKFAMKLIPTLQKIVDWIGVAAFGQQKLGDAFVGNQEKMIKAVMDGKMSIEDYNRGLIATAVLANTATKATDLYTDSFLESKTAADKVALGLTLVDDQWYKLTGTVKLLTQAGVDNFKTFFDSIPGWEKLAAAIEAANKAAAAAAANAPTDLSKLTPEAQAEVVKQYQTVQKTLADVETQGDEARRKIVNDKLDAITKLESEAAQSRADIIRDFAANAAAALGDMKDKQIGILTSYAEDEQKITEQQGKERMRLAQSFGVEAERMEQDHQLKMQRMSEDHGRRLSKLADSRDALGIADENSNYNTERRRADQDYQISARQHNEDYARQLADQNASFEDQRQARAAEKDKQLKELDDQYTKQNAKDQAAYQKQLNDLDTHTATQRQKIIDAQGLAMRDLESGLIAERTKANDQWTQWRNEHDIFLQGEKTTYDAFLQYQLDALKKSMGLPTSTNPLGIPTGVAGHASGVNMIIPPGYHENYPLGAGSSGEQFIVRNRAQQSAGMGLNISKVEINIAGTNASTEQIESAVYKGIIEVMQAATR